ncbi:hypothetical protein [Pseudodesulfovibrio portus]|uniref:Uncharacterized protein n=1 Tax=Pseudodesulfovibrio portus TaxID=231439 RepID=A0ABN6RR04_9BACT|nr:hypothetical protein [Pseudodesulfovibrio portus]BDQ33342.1 hypothetical protein JCM14722_08840 [Pseudodesulfovibrio portus]
MVAIQSIDGFIDSAVALLNQEIEIDEVEISDDFICTITINGDEHKGYVDYGLAKFIVLLQKNARSIIRSCTQDVPRSEQKRMISDVKVRVKVNEGSTVVDILLDYLFGGAVQNMTGEQAIYAILILCSTLCGMNGLSVISEIKKKAKDEETKQRFANIAEKLIEELPKINEPMRALANSLTKDDIISLPAIEAPLNKDEMKDLYKDIDLKSVQTIYIDDEYEILGVSLDKVFVTVKKGKAKFSASTKMLNGASKQQLYSAVKAAGIKEVTTRLPLQINMIIEGLDKEYYVMGIGDKREGAIDVESVVLKAVEDLLSGGSKQGTLF